MRGDAGLQGNTSAARVANLQFGALSTRHGVVTSLLKARIGDVPEQVTTINAPLRRGPHDIFRKHPFQVFAEEGPPCAMHRRHGGENSP